MWEIYSQCPNISREIKISQVLVFHFTTLFSDCLQSRIENLVEHLHWCFFAEIVNFIGSLKMVLWEILQNSQENICFRISFSIKLNSVDLQLHSKRDTSTVFLWIFQNSLEYLFFAELYQVTPSDYSSINSISNEERIGVRNCKLWYKNHVPMWVTSATY